MEYLYLKSWKLINETKFQIVFLQPRGRVISTIVSRRVHVFKVKLIDLYYRDIDKLNFCVFVFSSGIYSLYSR